MEVHKVPNNESSATVWRRVLRKEVTGSYFFETKNVTVETYKSLLRYFAFPKFREYLEDNISQQNGAHPIFSFLCVSIWTKSSPTVGYEELIPFHAFLTNWVLSTVATNSGIFERYRRLWPPFQFPVWKLNSYWLLQVLMKLLWKVLKNM